MPRTRIDSGPITHLPLCACGWRGIPTTTRATALAQAAAHETRAHPEQDRSRRAAREQARRDS